MKPEIIIDSDIPFIRGRVESWSEPRYLAGRDITRESLGNARALLIRTYTRCNAELLEGSKIEFIATATIGTDHIDLDYCRQAGITVCDSPGCNAPGVAQYVWSAVAALGISPEGLTTGVVGKGNVGSIVTEWGRRLGSDVIVCDPPRQKAGHTDEEYLPLDEILCRSDIVTLHTPLTRKGDSATYHLIDAEALSLMKPGAILINAARGGVVDTVALKNALAEGRIRAIIDTWEHEPDIDASLLPLVDIGTFHVAGYSHEGKQRATRMIIEAAGRHFNITPDTTGLAGPHISPSAINAEGLLASYDPRRDMALLTADPSKFLHLRDNYDFRHEYGICADTIS